MTLINRECPRPVLVYPVDHDLTIFATAAPATGSAQQRLGALLGRSCGEILILLADMHSTGELARQVGLSAATVSLHTTALREAGLITTTRDGRSAPHVLSPLGIDLCRACGMS